MALHCTVLRARELFILRMCTLVIQYPDPWGKSAIPNKENSPPCPGWGVWGLTLIGALHVCPTLVALLFRPKNGVTFAVLPSPFEHLTRCQSLGLDLPSQTLTTHPHTLTEDHLADRYMYHCNEAYFILHTMQYCTVL